MLPRVNADCAVPERVGRLRGLMRDRAPAVAEEVRSRERPRGRATRQSRLHAKDVRRAKPAAGEKKAKVR